MSNFHINFTYWWLMFLIIPAVFFTLLPYFRMAKRYRRTRNRILSITFHIAIMVMCISILAGMSFSYTVPNVTNEIVVLVDVSYSNRASKDDKIQFVEELIDSSRGQYKMSIVAFGKNPYTVVNLTSKSDELYGALKRFLTSEEDRQESQKLVKTDATDFVAALNHARSIFTSPEKGKIVVISDGLETDNNASNTIKTIASDGIRIDTKYIGNPKKNEVQITSVDIKDANYQVAQNVTVLVKVTCTHACTISLRIEDEVFKDAGTSEEISIAPIEKRKLYEGENEIAVEVKSVTGLHKLHFELDASGTSLDENEDIVEDDNVTFNNDYYSYVYLKNINRLLIVEGNDHDSDMLVEALIAENPEEFEYDVFTIDSAELPSSMDELRNYPQIVLVNVSASDMLSVTNNYNGSTVSFDQMLSDYAQLYGGSVLVTGGLNGESVEIEGKDGKLQRMWLSNVFDKEDIAKSAAFSDMLPVKVTSYTPSMAVMVVFDRSGSIRSSYLDAAKNGVIKYLESPESNITYRDYIGIMSFESSYTMDAELMSMRNLDRIKNTIMSINKGNATVYSGALQRAGQALINQKNVKKRQIIFITDGEPHDRLDVSDSTMQPYGPIIRSNFNSGVTLSIISFDKGRYAEDMEKAAVVYGGGKYEELNGERDLRGDPEYAANVIYEAMKRAVLFDQVNEFNDLLPNTDAKPGEEKKDGFTPIINRSVDTDLAATINTTELAKSKIYGYFGSYEKSGAEVFLSAPNAPLYARWNYGQGKVGTFMAPITSDPLSSNYTETFMSNDESKKLIRNIIKTLMPNSDIKPDEVWATLNEDNFKTDLSILYNELDTDAGEKIRIRVIDPSGAELTEEPRVTQPQPNDYSKASFTTEDVGLYTVTVEKIDANENVIGSCTYTVYKAFSYSKEYDMFVPEQTSIDFMDNMATTAKGISLSSASDAYIAFDSSIYKVYDPRMLFMILSIILLLLDIAVRKFKFKWLHEIIRDRKEAKALNKKR